MIKAVIFDMDGVLVDSEGIWNETLRRIVEGQGKRYDERVRKKTLGMKGNESMKVYKKSFGLRGSAIELWKKRKKMAIELFRKKLKMNNGAMRLVRQLKKRGYKLAIATSDDDEIFKQNYRKFGWKKYFKVVETGDDVRHGKPNPEIYIKTARSLGVKAAECAVIEDAPNGVMSAKNAGMTTIALQTRFTTRKRLRDADYIVKGLGDVLRLKILRVLNNL